MRKLLIADGNEDFRLALAELLREHFTVHCCCSGRETLDMLRADPWDILVLDLMLPELDGITLLERAVAEGIRPMVLAVTPLVTPYVYESAERLGIGYAMVKPCDVSAAAARARDLSRRLKPAELADPRSRISELLLSFGISTKHNGFDYLKEAVFLMMQDPGQPVTKVLYPAVAAVCRCASGHVERSIRSALDAAWNHRDTGIWQKYFPDADRRPSNAAFITRLAEELRSAKQA